MDVVYLHPTMTGAYKNRIELLQGTLDMIILQTLRWGPQHGYAISQAIRAGSGDVLQVETGSLYPALHRLQRRGLLKSEWKQSEYKQRTKVYSLTPKGKKELAAEQDRWNRMTTAIAGLMNVKESKA
jgi:PadR family transcriptional regulator, regulatory protein PadR